MSSDFLALFMDVVVLAALGVTVFFVVRLHQSLSDFKAHRREFDTVIANLLSSIDQAERSVNTLKQTSAQEAGHLEKLIHQSRALADELKIINDAGESMATRLEKLAETNRKLVKPMPSDLRKKPSDDAGDKISSPVFQDKKKGNEASGEYSSTLKKVKKDEEFPSFMIKDREYDDVKSLNRRLDASASNDLDTESDADMPEHLQSQAEKELFAALRNTKRNIGGDA